MDSTTLPFTGRTATVMHIDVNCCFATIEQQANPFLRGRPIAVAAYKTAFGCIIAPSVEAKKLGIRVGMRVKDGKAICPGLIVVAPDPWKYRNVHLGLRKIISGYTDDFLPKSIDEFTLNLQGYPALKGSSMSNLARRIKLRIKREIGEWLSVSVGIAPNRFLAKLASGLHKPDGLDVIDKDNFLALYSHLGLTDLPGIKLGNATRLNSVGIFNVLDFYQAPLLKLRAAFNSINSYYWYLRLRGMEIDNVNFARRSYGNSFALPKPLSSPQELSPVLSKLVEKASSRFRKAGYKAGGVHLAVSYRDGGFWHKGVSFDRELFDSRDIYKKAFRIFLDCPYKKPVRELAVSCFNLTKVKSLQLDLFEDLLEARRLVFSVDRINERWGSFVITPARMLLADKDWVPDRIAFGGVKELEEFTLKS